jgi:predicted transposase YbfD/YdcC
VAVSPEEIGLCGCWQIIAVERFSQNPNHPEEAASLDIGYYATSLALEERDDAAVLAAIRGHWSGSENGTHYRRDVTFAEDACRTASRPGAAALASLRNLAIGIYELQKERKRTKADSLRSWCQQQTFTTVWPLLNA